MKHVPVIGLLHKGDQFGEKLGTMEVNKHVFGYIRLDVDVIENVTNQLDPVDLEK